MSPIPEHLTRRVSYTEYANYCENCSSKLNKTFNKEYVSVLCSNTDVCEKVEEEGGND